MKRVWIVACGLVMGLSSCTHYACQAPDGKKCQPLSAIYRTFVGAGRDVTGPAAPAAGSPVDRVLPDEGKPVYGSVPHQEGDMTLPRLSRPRHMRIWLNAWVDADGDMHEHSYIYLRMDNGYWRRAAVSDPERNTEEENGL